MDTNQAAPQAPEANAAPRTTMDIAQGFLKDIEENPDPDQIEPDEPLAEQEAEPAAEQEEPEPEAETPNPDPVIEYEAEDGKKYQVPEALKPALMRDKDYRQKTMALAESRKQLEQLTANAQQIAAQAQQMAPYYAKLHAMENRAQQLERALASNELAQDPIEYNRTQGELAILLRNRDAFAQGLGEVQNQMEAQQAQLRAQKLALDAPKLLEEIPDIGKPEVQRALTEYAKQNGLTDFEISYLNYSAAGVRLAWKAKQYDAMVKDQAANRAKLAAKVQAAPTATKSSRAGGQSANTKQLQADWKKDGGNIHSPAFSALLRQKLRG